MRIGYGLNRIEKEFADANCDQIWIDGQHTERQERSAMLATGLRNGDTLVLLARGDLGRGGELSIIYRALADRGIDVDVVKPFSEKPKRKPGRPGFSPTPEQDAEIKKLWADPVLYTLAYVIRRVEQITGHTVDRNALYYRYGKRE